MKRREFIKKAAIGTGSLTALNLYDLTVPSGIDALSTSGGIGIEEALYYLEKGKDKNIMPEVRPEIRDNPRAVFLIETHVDAKRDKEGYDGYFTEAVPQLQAEGKRIAKERELGECDVNKIDIYWIRNGEIIPVNNLSEIKRHPLGLNWALQDDPEQRLFW